MKQLIGIILRVVPYEEKTRFVSLFSEEHGIVTLACRDKKSLQLSPLIKGEAIVRITEKEIWKCTEFSPLTSYPKLRTSLACLKSAVSMLDTVHKLVPPHVSVPSLYKLLDEHLQVLHEFLDPKTGQASFTLKLLNQEGRLPPKLSCEEELIRDAPCHKLYQYVSEKSKNISFAVKEV
jgi:DNA repair protein RecO